MIGIEAMTMFAIAAATSVELVSKYCILQIGNDRLIKSYGYQSLQMAHHNPTENKKRKEKTKLNYRKLKNK